MVLEDFSKSALPVWLTAAIFLTLLLGLSLFTASYQFIWYTSVVAATVAIFSFVHDTILRLFIFLLLFRYVRLIVNQAAFCLYKPVAVPAKPTLTAKDVTVIVPTVEPYGELFDECIRSIHANEPAKIIIVAAGPGNYDKAINSTGIYSNVRVMHCTVQNKRQQICEALPEVRKEGESWSL